MVSFKSIEKKLKVETQLLGCKILIWGIPWCLDQISLGPNSFWICRMTGEIRSKCLLLFLDCLIFFMMEIAIIWNQSIDLLSKSMPLFYMIETSVMKELNMIAIKGFCELAFWTFLFCQKFYKVLLHGLILHLLVNRVSVYGKLFLISDEKKMYL